MWYGDCLRCGTATIIRCEGGGKKEKRKEKRKRDVAGQGQTVFKFDEVDKGFHHWYYTIPLFPLT